MRAIVEIKPLRKIAIALIGTAVCLPSVALAQQNSEAAKFERFGDPSKGFFGDPAFGEFGVPPPAETPLEPPVTVRPLKPFDSRYLKQLSRNDERNSAQSD